MSTTLINGDLAVRRVLALHEAVPEIDLSRRRSGPRRSGEFDPNLYLTALPHLSLKQGYRLNFWYSGGETGGAPFVYCQREGDQPLTARDFQAEEVDLSAYQPANFLTVDGTAEAWFELVVFHRLAGQFYLFWHANYNDFSFITSSKKLNDVVKLRNEASEPLGQMSKDEHKIGISDLGRFVTVRYLGFSNWGGLYRFEETFTKAFPHRRIHDEKTHLMKYDCGICY